MIQCKKSGPCQPVMKKKKLTNSNLVQDMIKDPYNFDFVALSNNFTEKELPSTKEIESNPEP
jgi:predicted nuclease of restriction endonuclease-like (RecB) superfamily